MEIRDDRIIRQWSRERSWFEEPGETPVQERGPRWPVMRLILLVLVLALELQPAEAQTAAVRVEVNEEARFVNLVLRYWRWKGHVVRAVLDHQEPKCAPPEEQRVIRLCKKRLPGALIGLYDFVKQVAYVEPGLWDAGWVICHEVGHGLGYTHADRAIWACPGGPHPVAGV